MHPFSCERYKDDDVVGTMCNLNEKIFDSELEKEKLQMHDNDN